jgi:lipid-binding SYLF domain-containing protein
MSEKALNGLLSSSFKVGGDASIAAGPVGIGAASDVTADMVSFARSKGVYAGLSLEGTVIRTNEEANRAFYGQVASAVDVLVRANVGNPSATPLQQALRQMAR